MAHNPVNPAAGGALAWMAGHSVAANLIMLMCLVGGFLSLRNIRQEVFPDVALDTVRVTVAYPGASPEEVESGILLAIEEAVRGLDGVGETVSVAGEGVGTVSVELLLGTDPQTVAQDIRSEVDRVRTFPEDAEEPQVSVASHKREVLTVVLYGDASDRVLHGLGELVRDELLRHRDITQVDLTGLPGLEIAIEVPQENLRRYRLTLERVAHRLADAAVDIPGGSLKTGAGEVLVRVKERREHGGEFGALPIITNPDGSAVLLRDLAAIRDGFADTDRYSRYDGKPAVTLEVYRAGNETPISVANAVRTRLAAMGPSLPPGIRATILRDRSDVYRQRVALLIKNGSIGLALVFIVLGLFLEARLAFWVMMGIPISFLGSFLVLPATGVTINMISLFAYIVALGIVVDDAIVVGENVYHYRQQGLPRLQAAVRGVREVTLPVTFSILTNIVTFLPICVIPGVMGKIFKMIPIVVCTVFLISLGESLFVLPAHLGHDRARQRRGPSAWLHARQQAFSRSFRNWVRHRYGPFLLRVLRYRYVTIAVAVAILMLSLGYALSGRMGFQLFPVIASDFAEATVVLPYGAPVERTDTIMRRLQEGARVVCTQSGHPELVASMLSEVGLRGSHTCRVRIELAPPKVRDSIMSTEQFTERWRQAVGEVAGVEYLRFASDAGGPGSHERPLAVELSHRDIGVLAQASAELAATIRSYPRVKDVDDGFQPGKEQLDFTIKPEGKSLGLTAREVARQVRNAFYGAEVLRQQRGRNEVKVIVRLPAAERSTEQTVQDLLLRTADGIDVPLREVAEVRRGRAYTTIDRRNGRRVVEISADVVPRSKAAEVITDLQETALPALVGKYRGLQYSFEGHQADMRESLASLRVTFVLAMLAVYALLAIPFRSYAQPLIVMVSIPFGIVGALLGHLIMGYNLCIPSLFGVVALSGVVVNDSLIMIDFANRRRRQGNGTAAAAIHRAAVQRFRPILLTTLTTFGGLAPMIFETSRQARFLIPMALSLGYGLVFATGITLLLVPSLYLAAEDARRASARLRKALRGDAGSLPREPS